LADVGISMSRGYLSNLLIQKQTDFQDEFEAVYRAALASSLWQHFDQTGSRVGGINQTTNILCNPWYTIYQTTRSKDRLSVLGVLQNTPDLGYLFNEMTDEVLKRWKLPLKWLKPLQLFPQAQVLSESEFQAHLDPSLPWLNVQSRTRIQEAAAIAYYYQQSGIPVIQTLVCDDAPQFKELTDTLMLCWVHEARHDKKLTPVVAVHQRKLEAFLKQFWQYYRQLLDYRHAPDEPQAQALASEFERLMSEKSGMLPLRLL
jgi:hypothetical protein